MTLRTLSGSSGSKYSRDDASKSVETVSGLELIITACQPLPAERVGGLDRAVVELDALADADRPAADDQRRRALDRRRLRAPSRPPRRSRRSTASRPRTRRRTCRPSRSRARCPRASRAARSASGVDAGQPGQLLVAEAGALDRGQQLGGLGVASRRPAARPSPSSRAPARRCGPSRRGTRREIPVASPTTASGRRGGAGRAAATAASRTASRKRLRTIGRGAALGEAGALAGLPALVDPADRRSSASGSPAYTPAR